MKKTKQKKIVEIVDAYTQNPKKNQKKFLYTKCEKIYIYYEHIRNMLGKLTKHMH